MPAYCKRMIAGKVAAGGHCLNATELSNTMVGMHDDITGHHLLQVKDILLRRVFANRCLAGRAKIDVFGKTAMRCL